MTWYCVHTRPQMEAKASEYLRRQGYRAWFPFTREQRHRQFHGKQVRLIFDRPYFSRYIFVELSRPQQSLYDVNETYGVATVVRNPGGGDPLPIPAPVIRELMAMTDEDGRVIQDAPPHWFQGKVGDKVELIKDAPYYGLIAELASVAHLDKKDEISIFLDMLGASREIPIPARAVARVIGR